MDRVFLPQTAKVGIGIVGHFKGKQIVVHSSNHTSSTPEKFFAGCYGTSTARVTGVCRWFHSDWAKASFRFTVNPYLYSVYRILDSIVLSTTKWVEENSWPGSGGRPHDAPSKGR